MKWIFRESNPALIETLIRDLSLSPQVARILSHRGISLPETAQAFLHHGLKDLPSPFLFKDMKKAVDRLIHAITAKEKITIYGDYDVDGTVGTSILVRFFQEIGYPVHFYIPHRLREGYSLNKEALKTLHATGSQIIITVDNGASAIDDITFAKQLGLDVIITDHHELPPQWPDAFALINPLRPDNEHPDKYLCGSGVAFHLIMGLRQSLREIGFFSQKPEPNLRKYVDLVALATVADVVPLKGVNRILVKEGLRIMPHTAWQGLKALIDISLIDDKITSGHLGFRLGPRLNACGRLYDAATGVRLLTTDSIQEAKTLAIELDTANRERQEIEKQILIEAQALLEKENLPERLGLVLYQEHWHPGVIGIVASRIVEQTSRPVILLGREKENLKGSGRSFGKFNLVEALRECAPFLKKFGGHKAAAGVTLTLESFVNFREQFDQAVKKHLTPEECHPFLMIDEKLDPTQWNTDLWEELKTLEPFGSGNSEPVFTLSHITPSQSRLMGSEKQHIKFKLDKLPFIEATGFQMAHQFSNSTVFNLAFYLRENTFRGNTSKYLHLKDVQIPSL